MFVAEKSTRCVYVGNRIFETIAEASVGVPQRRLGVTGIS